MDQSCPHFRLCHFLNKCFYVFNISRIAIQIMGAQSITTDHGPKIMVLFGFFVRMSYLVLLNVWIT